jgi:hypothetical protein
MASSSLCSSRGVSTLDHGKQPGLGGQHSTSSGLSQGNQTGIGLRERQGAGSSMGVLVPGMQIEAFPNVTQGRI